MYIFIFDYTEGKVYKSELPEEHQAEPENFILENGFNLDNTHYMTTETKNIIHL